MECSRKENDEGDVKNVGLWISDWVPYIWDPKQPKVKINDGSLATQDMVKNILTAEKKRSRVTSTIYFLVYNHQCEA